MNFEKEEAQEAWPLVLPNVPRSRRVCGGLPGTESSATETTGRARAKPVSQLHTDAGIVSLNNSGFYLVAPKENRSKHRSCQPFLPLGSARGSAAALAVLTYMPQQCCHCPFQSRPFSLSLLGGCWMPFVLDPTFAPSPPPPPPLLLSLPVPWL